MFTADQIVAHLVGDYLLQSHWMATRKTKEHLAAFVHAIAYSVPFLLLVPGGLRGVLALALIAGTHFVIDRWRLARFVVWAKNWIGPDLVRLRSGNRPDEIRPRTSISSTGYPDDVPAWMAVWLLIIADNILHLLINGVVLWSFA